MEYRLLVQINKVPVSIWQGFKELCKAYELPYNTLKGFDYPRKHKEFLISRVPWRNASGLSNVTKKEIMDTDERQFYMGDDTEIIGDLGSKMISLELSIYGIEEAYYIEYVETRIREDQEWKNDHGFLKSLVMDNISKVIELEE